MQLLFWPFMLASLLVSIFAISLKKPNFLVISSILILPLSLYLAATPRFLVWGLVFPLFFVGSAVALSKKFIWLTVLLVSPNFLLVGWLGVSVINQ